MPIRTLLSLILCNLIWSAHPLMGKYVLEGFTPSQAAWVRYLSALVAYLVVVFAIRMRGRGREAIVPFLVPGSVRDAALLVALGFSAFCLSPLLQLSGLTTSRAADNALIVAMEPLMAVFLAWAILREPPTRLHFVAFGLALCGFGLLTSPDPGQGQGAGAGSADPRFIGNLLILLSLVGEALYSSLGRKLVARHPPAAVFGGALVIGVAFLTIVLAVQSSLPGPEAFGRLSWKGILGLLWLGPLGTAVSYLYWMSALRKISVATIALTLFVQPLFGPLWGILFLGERLTSTQGIGSGLIVIAVFGQAWLESRKIEHHKA